MSHLLELYAALEPSDQSALIAAALLLALIAGGAVAAVIRRLRGDE